MVKPVTSNSFGMVRSVTAPKDAQLEQMAIITPGRLGALVKRHKEGLDTKLSPGASWININPEPQGPSNDLQKRQKAFETRGLWSV